MKFCWPKRDLTLSWSWRPSPWSHFTLPLLLSKPILPSSLQVDHSLLVFILCSDCAFTHALPCIWNILPIHPSIYIFVSNVIRLVCAWSGWWMLFIEREILIKKCIHGRHQFSSLQMICLTYIPVGADFAEYPTIESFPFTSDLNITSSWYFSLN